MKEVSADFNSDYYGIRDVQIKLKEILSKIDRVCRENDIEYSIAYVTQIGAVRHGGFIPWDDDADLIMTRYNFNRFKNCIKNSSELSLTYYLWVERVTDKEPDENLFVDIMILDSYPEKKLGINLKAFLSRMCQGMMHEKIEWNKYSPKFKVMLAVTQLIGKIIGKRNCYKLYSRIQTMWNKSSTEYLASYNSGYADVKIPFKANYFKQYIDIEFEDLVLRSNKQWHEVLSLYYGDYMELPPIEKRVPEHGRE